MTELELNEFFSQFGIVKDSKIITDRNGVSKGCEIIIYCICKKVLVLQVYFLATVFVFYFLVMDLSRTRQSKKQHGFVPRYVNSWNVHIHVHVCISTLRIVNWSLSWTKFFSLIIISLVTSIISD